MLHFSHRTLPALAGLLSCAIACGGVGDTSSTGSGSATEASTSTGGTQTSGSTSGASLTGSETFTGGGSGTGTTSGSDSSGPTSTIGESTGGDGTTGGSTSGGTTGLTTGSSTGGGQVCPDLQCGECFACATVQPDYCADQKAACAADADCTALAGCVSMCPPVGDPGFEKCHDDCVDGMPGENLFKDLGACLACDTCACSSKDHPEC